MIGQVTNEVINRTESNETIIEHLESDTSKSFTYPEFPGGDIGLFTYLSKKTKYPNELKDSGIKGIVYVSFLITETGEIPIDSIQIKQSLHPLLDEEAIRLISKMPNWKPATDQKGNSIKIRYNFPIRFL